MEIKIDQLSKELLQYNIRPSFQRLKIFEYLKSNHNHPTVDMIYSKLKDQIPTLSKTTVYNTLNLFIESELVKVVNIDEYEARYDINTGDHGHFRCDSCGQIFDFSCKIEKLDNENLKNFKINERHIYLNGICPECLKKQSDN